MHNVSAPVAPTTYHCRLQKAASSAHVIKHIFQRKIKKQIRVKLTVEAAFTSSFANRQVLPTAENPSFRQNFGSNGDPLYSTLQSGLGSSTTGKWLRDDESALRRNEPLPLPMAYPGSAPAREDVESMKNCDPEIKDCRDVIYQWTGECSRCQGTGDITYHNREGRELIWKCITCLGLDYAGDLDNIRSTSGYVFTMVGGAVSWRSRLQTCVTQTTTEAEYVAASEACKEAIWLARLVTDLGIKEETPMLHCDSQSAIQLVRNSVYHSKTNHVDVKYHFIRKMVEDKQVQLVKVHTTDNPADLLTKGLPVESFAHCRKLLRVG
ncbi:hypothetical protein L7F22_046947 [Adiantum nelumboides]|nr:hypothetical protein [Adiantum nelumboides]